jgi:hypothetical protein
MIRRNPSGDLPLIAWHDKRLNDNRQGFPLRFMR